MSAAYPAAARERDEWVLSHRAARNPRDPNTPYAFYIEEERVESGEIVPTATIFLTNRECPWRCVMCDLWRDTLEQTVPLGAIPAQIEFALGRLGPARQVKLYNAGSFFDTRAVPVGDHDTIAARVREFDRVIVECHPALVNESAVRFHEMLGGKLEVALGLETAHPDVLEKLNKRVTLERFAQAAAFLEKKGIALRVFILVQPPFMLPEESLDWACRTIDFAMTCGAGVISLIPTRGGNGAMEVLAGKGQFVPPNLATLEAATEYGIRAAQAKAQSVRVFADLWDLEKFSDCPSCFAARKDRLAKMNHHQESLPEITCPIEH